MTVLNLALVGVTLQGYEESRRYSAPHPSHPSPPSHPPSSIQTHEPSKTKASRAAVLAACLIVGLVWGQAPIALGQTTSADESPSALLLLQPRSDATIATSRRATVQQQLALAQRDAQKVTSARRTAIDLFYANWRFQGVFPEALLQPQQRPLAVIDDEGEADPFALTFLNGLLAGATRTDFYIDYRSAPKGDRAQRMLLLQSALLTDSRHFLVRTLDSATLATMQGQAGNRLEVLPVFGDDRVASPPEQSTDGQPITVYRDLGGSVTSLAEGIHDRLAALPPAQTVWCLSEESAISDAFCRHVLALFDDRPVVRFRHLSDAVVQKRNAEARQLRLAFSDQIEAVRSDAPLASTNAAAGGSNLGTDSVGGDGESVDEGTTSASAEDAEGTKGTEDDDQPIKEGTTSDSAEDADSTDGTQDSPSPAVEQPAVFQDFALPLDGDFLRASLRAAFLPPLSDSPRTTEGDSTADPLRTASLTPGGIVTFRSQDAVQVRDLLQEILGDGQPWPTIISAFPSADLVDDLRAGRVFVYDHQPFVLGFYAPLLLALQERYGFEVTSPLVDPILRGPRNSARFLSSLGITR